MRAFITLVSMLVGAILGATTVWLAISTLFGLGGVTRRGTHLDADWPTVGMLGVAAIVFLGIAKLAAPKEPGSGD